MGALYETTNQSLHKRMDFSKRHLNFHTLGTPYKLVCTNLRAFLLRRNAASIKPFALFHCLYFIFFSHVYLSI